ncbi:MAG: very short patch repair endonuclease [Acidimicrobiales bacterium]
MRRQRRRDTKPEMELRRLLHRKGYRYRVDRAVLPGSRRRHDLVFSSVKVAVEVRGCFWHSCPQHTTQPKTNSGWWTEKLMGNVARDTDTAERLSRAGWELVVVWEHEDSAVATERVARVIDARRCGTVTARP